MPRLRSPTCSVNIVPTSELPSFVARINVSSVLHYGERRTNETRIGPQFIYLFFYFTENMGKTVVIPPPPKCLINILFALIPNLLRSNRFNFLQIILRSQMETFYITLYLLRAPV